MKIRKSTNSKLYSSAKIILLSISILLGIAITASLFVDYGTVIDWVMYIIKYPQDERVVLESVLTPTRILIVQCALSALLFIIVLALYYFREVLAALFWFVSACRYAIKGLWQDIKSPYALVLLLPILASIYFGITTPVSYDESFTYLTFTYKPFFYCMIFYPYPNNHVLFSIMTNVVECLPFFSILFKLRLSAIIFSALASIIAFSFVKRYYSYKVSALVVGIASMLFMSVYYSFMARGYGMLCLFFIIGLYAAFNIIYKGNKTKDWLFFAISSMLGFYTMPSFLYPFITLNVLILIHNYNNIKKQLIFNTISIVGVILLYTPIIIIDGVKALIGNNFVVPINRLDVLNKLPIFCKETLEQIFYLPFYIILPVLLIACIFTLRQKGRWSVKGNNIFVIWILFIVAPCILLLTHSVIPFPRTFIYYGFVLIFLIVIPFREFIDKLPKAFLLTTIFVIQIVGLINFDANIGKYETFNTMGKEINDLILQEPNKTYFLAPSYGITNFNFEYSIRGYDTNKIVEGHSHNASADTIHGYDYVVIDVFYDHTIERKPFFSNQYQNVYTR